MIIKFNIGLFPCQLAAVVFDDSSSAKEVHLVVQSTTTHTLAKSTLSQEWNWSPEYISVCPNTIEAPCFVISLRDDNPQVVGVWDVKRMFRNLMILPTPAQCANLHVCRSGTCESLHHPIGWPEVPNIIVSMWEIHPEHLLSIPTVSESVSKVVRLSVDTVA